MWFALPFGAGCALCQYLLPERLWLWAAPVALALGLLVFLLRGEKGWAARIAAVGCCAGILWFSGYAARYLAPAEALVGSEHVFELELTDYPEEATGGARCEVKMEGLRGRAVFYGGRELLDLGPGDRIVAQCACYSAATLAGEESSYYVSKGGFVRL